MTIRPMLAAGVKRAWTEEGICIVTHLNFTATFDVEQSMVDDLLLTGSEVRGWLRRPCFRHNDKG